MTSRALIFASFHHRPDSEMAYIYKNGQLHIRFSAAIQTIKRVELIGGDPYLLKKWQWYKDATLVPPVEETSHTCFYQVEIEPVFKRLSYVFRITLQDDSRWLYTDRGIFPDKEEILLMEEIYFRFPFVHDNSGHEIPEWVRHTVWYQIFPERFANGDRRNDPDGVLAWNSKRKPKYNDFFGGDLQGILDHLDYLEELGINGIYLCPIFTAQTNHKYDTIDYFEIDPHFGDKHLLKKLIDACHARGMKVMLDAVFNHLGYYAKEWQDVLKQGASSPYKEWFHIRDFPLRAPRLTDAKSARVSYDTFAFASNMPKLNTSHPKVCQHLLAVARYWIEAFDIDGWRLDVANEIDHEFWRDFRNTCHDAKKDFYILGEIWHSSQSWLMGDQFDAVMNYGFTDAILHYFADDSFSSEEFMHELARQRMLYREQTNQVMLNLATSHDTPRLLYRCQGNKELMKQVLAFIFLQKGSPGIYYGDEVGLSGGPDPDNRRCMPWDKTQQGLHLFAFYQELIAFRKKFSDHLSLGHLNFDREKSQNGLLVFSINYQDTELVAYFNKKEEQTLAVEETLLQQGFENKILRENGFVIAKSGKSH
ncbi:glycoside hydrolase family 13 protein [Streptococcus hyovaginalis]